MSTHMQNIKRKLGRVSAQVRSLFSKKQTHKNLAMQQVMSVKEVKKLPNSKQLKHFPSLLSKRERTIAGVALLAIIISGIFLVRSLVGTQQTTIAAIGGEYTEGIIGSPQLINPLYSLASDVDTDLSRLIYSGLTKYSSLEGAALDLAQSYSVSEDGLEYTFTIQENAKWHDGNPVLADDVIFTIFTDSMEMYQSRMIEEAEKKGPYKEMNAAVDFEGCLVQQDIENFLELGYRDRKRVHNLKYYTWVEQQGKTYEEINEQWDEEYWRAIFEDEVVNFDKLINEFNKEVGLLEKYEK